MKILGIDTSAVTASCAVCETCEDRRVICEGSLNTRLVHSQTLIPFMESMLKNADIRLSDIDVFAVSAGPGSFTGLRIAISAVKGMAYALGKPCRAVSTLSAIAYNFTPIDAIICAVMDARRDQVYNALFRIKSGNAERLCEDRAISVEQLGEELKNYTERIIIAGDGTRVVKKSLPQYEIAPPTLMYQSGTGVCFAAEGLPDIDAAAIMPVYLRIPQAERERQSRG